MSDEEIKTFTEQVDESKDISFSTDLKDTDTKDINAVITDTAKPEEVPVKKRRGRPRKTQSANTSMQTAETKTPETKSSRAKKASESDSNLSIKDTSEISNAAEPKEKSVTPKSDEDILEKPTSSENVDAKTDSPSESTDKPVTKSRSRKTKKPKQEETSDESDINQKELKTQPKKKTDNLSKQTTKKESKKETVSYVKTQDKVNLTNPEMLTDTNVIGTLLIYKAPTNTSIRRAITGRFEYVSHYNDAFVMIKYVKPSIGLVFGYVKKSEYIDKINS